MKTKYHREDYDALAQQGLHRKIVQWFTNPKKVPEILVGDDGLLRIVRLGLRKVINNSIKEVTGRNYYRIGIYNIIDGWVGNILRYNPHFEKHINPSNHTRYIIDIDELDLDEEMKAFFKKVVSEREPPKQITLD